VQNENIKGERKEKGAEKKYLKPLRLRIFQNNDRYQILTIYS
jgi:hypothetical protein